MPLNNFGHVSGNLYRSAQPDAKGCTDLKEMGFDCVYRFNSSSLGSLSISEEAAALGYVNFHPRPLPFLTVDPQQCLHILHQIEKDLSEGAKVLIHCEEGRDRTGLFGGMHRLIYDVWSLDQVSQERETYGVNWVVALFDYEIGVVLKEIAADPGRYRQAA